MGNSQVTKQHEAWDKTTQTKKYNKLTKPLKMLDFSHE
jgi:hypothetical protein